MNQKFNENTFVTLEKLHDLKVKNIISDEEYEYKKTAILEADKPTPTQPQLTENTDRKIGHGISLLVGSVILFIILSGVLGGNQTSQDDLQEALGAIILFGAWIVPHSIWLLTQKGANIILPIIALALTGFCALAYVGNLS
ncbi:SHOCT domain-containing protein [Acetobacter orientalis]|uniref:SHOCT domain-containing protein n=1 Tax=Acetobacter orientalis TaxID=146474 RepID=UPI0020A31CCA|nr:SHOCT domain-containing protein [Acetobacter orientalis]MCP1220362.1 SHOCT domain-containing protein [Acetobacter orientalis]